jgi:hypothetical protein
LPAATNVITTTQSLSTLMRQVQTKAYKAANFGFDEWNEFQNGRLGKDFKVAWSTRSILVPLDLAKGIGTASIPEGGYEARPSSPALVEAALSFIMLNKRITFSRLQEILRQKSKDAFIENDLKYQGLKAVEAFREKFAMMAYGFSSGTVALVSGSPGGVGSNDLTLRDMYGISGLGSLAHNRQVVDQFQAGTLPTGGDWIAVLNPVGPTLRAGGIVQITAKNRSTNTITCGASGITGVADGDLIVFANNNENTTLAGGTERNLNLVGLLDMLTSASLHNISGGPSGTYPQWTAGYVDTSGGKFTPVKFRKMKQGIQNNGPAGADITDLWLAQGVFNDLTAQQEAGVRFTGGGPFELDGEPTGKGLKIHQSRFTPDGYAFGYDKNNSIRKGQLFPGPDEQPFDEENTDKLENLSAKASALDFPIFLFTTSRGAMGYASGATQQ